MDPATIAALSSAATSLGGSFLQNKANEKLAKQSAENRAKEIEMIKQYGQRATESLLPAYQQAQAIRQQGMNQQLGLAGQTFQPMVDVSQAGDYMAQQTLLDTLKQKQNARMTGDIDYSVFQPQNVPMDLSALSGLTNPQALQFQPFEQIEYSDAGVTDWSAGDAGRYLEANQDIKQDYMANRAALLAGGDPQFKTLEGYAKWHYDNYGRKENRPLKLEAPDVKPKAQGEAFSYDQVYKALNQMVG